MSKIAEKKKLVILNDNLEQALKDIEVITNYGVMVEALMYFSNNMKNQHIPDNIMQKLEKLGVKFIPIETFDFYYILETMYEDCNVVFLFDIDLGIEEQMQVNHRIQVCWARHKVINDNGKDRFFFYSTYLLPVNMAGINSRFPNKILEYNYLNVNEYPEVLPEKNKDFCSIFGI